MQIVKFSRKKKVWTFFEKNYWFIIGRVVDVLIFEQYLNQLFDPLKSNAFIIKKVNK